jgi:hypothetical protein
MLRHAMLPPTVVEGHKFHSIVRPRFRVKCGLEIQLLVNHDLVPVVRKHGDLDNRLKTFFDGLRIPQTGEIKNFKPESTKDDDYCCLLEDDALITNLHVETFRNLSAPTQAPNDYVRINLMVTVEPDQPIIQNEAFRGD